MRWIPFLCLLLVVGFSLFTVREQRGHSHSTLVRSFLWLFGRGLFEHAPAHVRLPACNMSSRQTTHLKPLRDVIRVSWILFLSRKSRKWSTDGRLNVFGAKPFLGRCKLHCNAHGRGNNKYRRNVFRF